MANALKTDLNARHVVLKQEAMKPHAQSISHRVLFVTGGFGASAITSGTAVFGVRLINGQEERWAGYDIERFATEFEVMQAEDAHRELIEQAKSEVQAAENVAKSLTSGALAERIAMLASDIRSFDRTARDAYLIEAASRLANQ